jgi:cobalt-zinc-cadmium efflux system protein
MSPHPNPNLEKRFIFSLALTALIFIAEVIGGLWTGSLALLSDSAHVFLDIFALGLSFLALRFSNLPANSRYTYGYHRLEVLAALANGLTLGVVAIGIFGEAWQRWQSPEPIKSFEMLVIAAIGLLVNLAVAFVLNGHSHTRAETEHAHEDVNVKSAYLHVLGDAVSSVGVILGALIISMTGWLWVDPLTSVLIGLIILLSSARVLKSALHILLEGAPQGFSLVDVASMVSTVAGIVEIHDLHLWSLCSGHVALSAHVVLPTAALQHSEPIMAELKHSLRERFDIEHTTIQFECASCGQGQSMDTASTHPLAAVDVPR